MEHAAPSTSLYGHWICPYVSRVWFALAQRGIDFDVIDLPPSAVRGPDFVLPPEFVAHSPKLEVPMVSLTSESETEYLADSIPILEWLEDRFADAPLLPVEEEQRVLVRERMAWIDRNVFWPMGAVYYGTDTPKIEQAAETLAASLDQVDTWLADSPWLAGSHPTLVEAVLMPFYIRLDGLRPLGFVAPLPQRVDNHRLRCTDLAGWSAVAWSQEQTREFVGHFEAYRRKNAG